MMEVVAGPEGALRVRTTLIRDAESRISDTRVRCMPAVAKRGRTRSVALVTTERPVHERTLARAVREVARLSAAAVGIRAFDSIMMVKATPHEQGVNH